MKIQTILATLIAGGLLLSLTACSKQEVKDNTTKAVDATKNAADKAATAVKESADKAVDATKDAAQKTGDAISDATKKAVDATKDAASTATQATKEQIDAAKTATSSASADIMAVLESAKKLASEGKWQEATKALEPLSKLKLTPEQQSLLDQLKKQLAQLQAGGQQAADEAAKAVGNLLKK